MYRNKLNDILNLIEKNHIDMYFNITKEELDEYIDKIFKENNINNDYDFYYYTNVIIKKIFGIYDSHTKLIWYEADFNLPLRFKYIDNKVYIIRTSEDNKELLYSEVLKINGIDINVLIDEIKNMIAYSTKEYLIYPIETILYNGIKLKSLPSIDSTKDEFEFTLKKDNEIINKQFTKSEESLIKINKPRSNYSYHIINDKMHIVYNMCREEYENQMINFVEEINKISSELNINKFIVDIRGNQGGNSAIINPLIEFLKNKEVITLVDEYVFSGGRFAILDLKNIDSKFVGTNIGTSLNCFGNAPSIKYDKFIIPICNKYFYMDTTYKYENFKYADTKEKFKELKRNKKLFIPQIFEPDYYSKKTLEDYKDGIDKELECAIEIFDNKKVK
ncbi:MAG: hypothetical protein E7157_01845 [Lactobacillales bacterium]|nr:hypothetical protein [Lactobacillales bacterium]